MSENTWKKEKIGDKKWREEKKCILSRAFLLIKASQSITRRR